MGADAHDGVLAAAPADDMEDAPARLVAKYLRRRGVLAIVVVDAIVEMLGRLLAAVPHDGQVPVGQVPDVPVRVVKMPLVRVEVHSFDVPVHPADGEARPAGGDRPPDGRRYELYLRPAARLGRLADMITRRHNVMTVPVSALFAERADGGAGAPAGRKRAWALVMTAALLTTPRVAWGVLGTLARWLAVHSVPATVRSALRPLPVLLAALLVVFITGDAWRIFGEEPAWRLTGLIVILLVLAFLAMLFNLRGPRYGWRAVLGYPVEPGDIFYQWATRKPRWCRSRRKRADRARVGEHVRHVMPVYPVTPLDPAPPGAALQAGGSPPVPLPRAFSAVQQVMTFNMRIVFWLTMIPVVVMTGVLIFGFFVLIGVVAISQDRSNDLLGNGMPGSPVATVWVRLPLLGQQFVVTQQLVLLSAALGAFAALNFATGILQDAATRAEFADHALQDARGAMGGLAFYMGGVADLLRKLDEAGILTRIKDLDVTEMREFLAFPQGQGLPAPGPGPARPR